MRGLIGPKALIARILSVVSYGVNARYAGCAAASQPAAGDRENGKGLVVCPKGMQSSLLLAASACNQTGQDDKP